MLKKDDIQKKKDMLNVIGDVGAAVQTQKKTRKKKAVKGKKVPLEPAPIDAKYESLGSSLAQVSHVILLFSWALFWAPGFCRFPFVATRLSQNIWGVTAVLLQTGRRRAQENEE